jgi:hypothetical protein
MMARSLQPEIQRERTQGPGQTSRFKNEFCQPFAKVCMHVACVRSSIYYLSIYLTIICLSSIYLSIYLPIYLSSICLSVCLSTYLFIITYLF